jgi:hypothetical protein
MAGRAFIDRISPTSLGVGISLALIALLVVSETVLGRWDALLADENFDPLARVPSGVLRDLRIAFVHCLLAGYLPAAFLHVIRNGKRTVTRLQVALDCTREECETLANSIRLSGRGLFTATLIGFVIALTPPYLVAPVPDAPWNPAEWNAEVVWHRLLGPVIGVGLAWLAYAISAVSLRMSRIAQKLNRIDLLDLAPLAPFAQQGLTNALLLVGVLSIASLMMLETGFMMLMLIIGSSTLVLAVLVLLAPVFGVQKRVSEAKQQELIWINEQIAGLRAGFAEAQTGRKSGDLADMVAYRALIENVPDWPFTGSTYVRLLIYALIPLASWGVGIVAEEFIGRLIL